jgi:hypothetical protein
MYGAREDLNTIVTWRDPRDRPTKAPLKRDVPTKVSFSGFGLLEHCDMCMRAW